MSDIWIQTGTGRALDLMAPAAGMIDLDRDVAEALAREPRFGGHVRAGAYSVAQHMVLGCDCILAETGDIPLARAFVLHDAHEYACKDITTPLADALEMRVDLAIRGRLMAGAEDAAGWTKGVFDEALAGLKADLDRAIFAAAGLPWPLPPEIAAAVKVWDMAMLAAEIRDLLPPPPKPWHPAVRAARAPRSLRGRITVWPWPKAADEWRARLHRLFPTLTPEQAGGTPPVANGASSKPAPERAA